MSTLGVVLIAVCAVLAIRVVRLVNRLQMSRPWTPWWATDLSTAPPAQYEMTDSETPVQRQLWSAQHLQQIQGASVTTPYGQGPQQPYGQQPYGAPQMGYPAAPGGVKPNNYLAWSIVSIILFWPLGIAAIINATKVDPAWQMGNAAMAQEHSNKAKMFSMIATIIGAVGFVIYFIIGMEVRIVAIWQRIASSTHAHAPAAFRQSPGDKWSTDLTNALTARGPRVPEPIPPLIRKASLASIMRDRNCAAPGVNEPEATQSSTERLRPAGTRSEMQVPGDGGVPRTAWNRLPSGSLGSTKGTASSKPAI